MKTAYFTTDGSPRKPTEEELQAHYGVPERSPPVHTVGEGPRKDVIRRYLYWKLDRTGNPIPDFTDTPHLYPHAHLVEIPVPQDVQDCMSEFQHPPACLVIEKTGLMAGNCTTKPTNETSAL